MQRVIHFEILHSRSGSGLPVYQDVFGWKFKKFEGGPIEYWLVTTGDDKTRELMAVWRPREGQRPGTINTIAVPSLDQSIKKLRSAAERFVCRRWRSQRWAGSPMLKIRRQRLRNHRATSDSKIAGRRTIMLSVNKVAQPINERTFSEAAVADRGNKPKRWRK